MRIDAFDYELPEELVAVRPPADRDGGRLLVLGADRADPEDRAILDLPELLAPSTLLVVNDTRVLPARLFGHKPTGGRVELLLLERIEAEGPSREAWRAIARASKGIGAGTRISIEGASDLSCEVLRKDVVEGTIEVLLTAPPGATVASAIERAGHVPLPPYVNRPDELADRERYQTLFARSPGAVAAPTAGLHLSERLLDRIAARGITLATVTLHVSLGTFQPVKVDDLDDHPMHAEWFDVGEDVASAIAAARERGAPVVAIGTTVVRALESAADPVREGYVVPRAGRTRLLIQPGYRFRVVDGLLTNFHLPRSTLLALVSAFAGHERTMAAYRAAVSRRYRFFSYGDAMLIAPERRS